MGRPHRDRKTHFEALRLLASLRWGPREGELSVQSRPWQIALFLAYTSRRSSRRSRPRHISRNTAPLRSDRRHIVCKFFLSCFYPFLFRNRFYLMIAYTYA